jgi:hypothetical protein
VRGRGESLAPDGESLASNGESLAPDGESLGIRTRVVTRHGVPEVLPRALAEVVPLGNAVYRIPDERRLPGRSSQAVF